MSASAREYTAATTVFCIEDFAEATGLKAPSARRTLHLLVKAGVLRRLYAGVFSRRDAPPNAAYWAADYVLRDLEHLFSFESALELHGLCAPSPYVGVIFPSERLPRVIDGRPLVPWQESAFKRLGTVQLEVHGRVVPCATAERAIIDLFDAPRGRGGILRAARLLAAVSPRLDLALLVELALDLERHAAQRRLGYVLERLGVTSARLEHLRRNLTESYSVLDPDVSRTVGTALARWRLKLNHDEAQLAAALAPPA